MHSHVGTWLSPQSWEHEIIHNVLVSWRVHWNKVTEDNTWQHYFLVSPWMLNKVPHTLDPTLKSALHLAHYSQTSTVLIVTTKLRLVHQTARQRNTILHSREQVSTALEALGTCIALDDVRQLGLETQSMKLYALFLRHSEGHEVWRSVVTDSAESWWPLHTRHLSIHWLQSVILHVLTLYS